MEDGAKGKGKGRHVRTCIKIDSLGKKTSLQHPGSGDHVRPCDHEGLTIKLSDGGIVHDPV